MPEPSALTPAAPAAASMSEATEPSRPDSPVERLLVEDDLVIEEVSIDGMCGVY
jgi:mycofactocin precursor